LSALLLGFSEAANIDWSNDYFGISVTGNGNVPKYSFWLQSNTSNVYSVFFHQFFEATGADLKKNGPSNIALPSLTWEWTEIHDDGSGTLNFNITAKDGGHGPNKQFSSLALVNWIHANETKNKDNTTTIRPLLKFDVIIDDYTWVSTDATAKVVLLFDLTSHGGDSSNSKAENNKIVVDGAYFGINGTALSFNNPDETTEIGVTLLTGTGKEEKGIWMVYDHWTGAHLVHDPTMGIDGEEDGGVNVLAIVLPIVACAVLIGAGVAFYMYKKRGAYTSI
jgi:hypothetical protein